MNTLDSALSGIFAQYHFKCIGADGTMKWEETVHNLFVDVGTKSVLNFGTGQAATPGSRYMGLLNGTLAKSDTMASHAGWSEITAYSQSPRPSAVFNAASGTSPTFTATTTSSIQFTMNAAATVSGAFICDNSTIGGATGTLYSETNFTTVRTVGSGDLILVTPTWTLPSA